MKRTEVLHEIRKMRFKKAYNLWQERRLSQEEAFMHQAGEAFKKSSEKNRPKASRALQG